MAAVTKIVIMCCLLSVVSTSGAGETKDDGKELVQFAYAKMTQALEEADSKVGVCMEKEKNTILPPQVFPKLPLSKSEWGSALVYLSFKAQTRCEENSLANAVLAFSQFKTIEKEMTGKNSPDVYPAGRYKYEFETLCCGSLKTELRTEMEYKKIDPKIRQTLESIPEFKQPFNPIAALKTLGLKPSP